MPTLHWKNDVIYDQRGYALGVDFVNSWMMGKLAHAQPAPEGNYFLDSYYPQLQAQFGEHYSKQLWSYPPSYILFMLPFGQLPYLLALSLFMGAGITLFAWSCRAFSASWKILFAAGFMSPAALFGLISGQIIFFMTALQLWIFKLLDSKPWLAGTLLGLLSIKPQLGIAYPFFLLATRRWKVFAAAAITTLTLVLVSSVVLGMDMWKNYVLIGIPAQQHYFVENPLAITRQMMPTLYMDLTNAGVNDATAWGMQFIAALGCVALFFTRRFKALGLTEQMLCVAASGILMSPYLMGYDTVFFTMCVVLCLQERSRLTRLSGVLFVSGYFFIALYMGAASEHWFGLSLIPAACVAVMLYVKPQAPEAQAIAADT